MTERLREQIDPQNNLNIDIRFLENKIVVYVEKGFDHMLENLPEYFDGFNVEYEINKTKNTLENIVEKDMLESGFDPTSKYDIISYWRQKGLVDDCIV